MACATPGLRLPSKPQDIAALQRITRVYQLLRRLTLQITILRSSERCHSAFMSPHNLCHIIMNISASTDILELSSSANKRHISVVLLCLFLLFFTLFVPLFLQLLLRHLTIINPPTRAMLSQLGANAELGKLLLLSAHIKFGYKCSYRNGNRHERNYEI